jgi:hypothetical protein
MSEAQKHFSNNSQDILQSMPIIYFIEPILVKLTHNRKEKNILIERYLEGEYKKFNSNMGYVEDEVKQLVNCMNDLGLGSNLRRPKKWWSWCTIVEDGDKEEESDDDTNKEMFDSKHLTPYRGQYKYLQDAYFSQAFRHFSFVKSKMKLMVADLQGGFTQKDDGS